MEETFPLDCSWDKRNCLQAMIEFSFTSASCACWCLADNAKYCTVGSYFMHGTKESSLGNVEDLYIFPNPYIYIYSLFKTLNSKDLNICFLFLNAL